MSVTNQLESVSQKHFSFFCNDQSHGPANDINCKVETPPRYFFCGSFIFFCLVFAMPSCASVLCALWSPAAKGWTSWLSFLVSNCEFVTFPLYPGSIVVLDCIDS